MDDPVWGMYWGNGMKGIVLAGGAGTRLRPATGAISKQLLPVYDKPMIYYPLSVYLHAGIRDILIITTVEDAPLFKRQLGDGSNFGINLQYAVQENPNGLAEAFIIGENFLNGSASALILGDNIFYGEGIGPLCVDAAKLVKGATVFAYEVSDPERYGVVTFDAKTSAAVKIEEKPKNPESNWAVTGLYFYDSQVCKFAKSVRPSPRGELEITDLNKMYLEKGTLKVQRLGRGYAWLDTGTFDSLHEAAAFVRTIELRQGIKIACLEEIALTQGFISGEEVIRAANAMGKSDYSAYMKKCVDRAAAHGH
jgi:glucose-1-phosphate thymidylyltransferase